MKTKLLIILAMLLLSTSSFAQSENIGTLKGDVNGDGKVDVADINAVLSIMKKGEAGYFYLGTTRPTAWGYQTLPGVVASYTSIGEASGTTVSVAAGETLYMLCPVGWMEGKDLEIEDGNGNTFSFLEDFDAVTISGYVIYKTQVWTNAAEITLITPTGHLFTASSNDANANLQQLTWTDKGEFVNNWTGLIYSVDDGYIFLKVPSQDTISKFMVNPSYQAFMYEVPLEPAINTNDGYHVYRTSNTFMCAGNAEFKITK